MRIFVTPYRFVLMVMISSLLISGTSLLSQSIRLDESQSIWVATKSIRGIILAMAQDVHPPLYLLLLHVFITLFGTNVLVTRLLSLGFFIASIPLLYRLAERYSSPQTAILTVTFYALSPFILWFSNETRMYSLFTLVTVINHGNFLKLYESDGQNGRVAYMITLTLGMYTHYFFALVVITQLLYAGFKSRWNVRFLVRLMVPIAGTGLLFLPWFVLVLTQGFGKSAQPLLGQPSVFNLIASFVNFYFGFQNTAAQSLLVSFWPLAILIMFLVFTTGRKEEIEPIDYFFLQSFLPILLAFGASAFRPIFLPRYLIFTLPSIFFLTAWSLSGKRSPSSRFLTTVLLGTMIVFLIVQNVSSRTPVREDYREVAAFLTANADAQDIVAINSPFTIYPLEYSYRGHARLTTIPEWNRYEQQTIPEFSIDTLESQLERYRQVYSRMFVVLSYDQGYQQALLSYLDNRLELLEVHEYPTGIQLRVYRLRYFQ